MVNGVRHVCIEVGPFTVPPAIDEIDCSRLTRSPGGILRIRQARGVRLDRVIVLVHGEISGLLEGALAHHQPGSLDWFYTTTAQVPPGEGIFTEVRAVPTCGQTTIVILDETPERLSFEVTSGDETHRMDICKQRRPGAGPDVPQKQPSRSYRAAVFANVANN